MPWTNWFARASCVLETSVHRGQQAARRTQFGCGTGHMRAVPPSPIGYPRGLCHQCGTVSNAGTRKRHAQRVRRRRFRSFGCVRFHDQSTRPPDSRMARPINCATSIAKTRYKLLSDMGYVRYSRCRGSHGTGIESVEQYIDGARAFLYNRGLLERVREGRLRCPI